MSTFIERSKRIVNLQEFKTANSPDEVFSYHLTCPHEHQYILRMMIKRPHEGFNIPRQLLWAKELIYKCQREQDKANLRQSYCYITVRHGEVSSVTDDEWHTDGYSEVISHIPEQNYFVTNCYPTEYVEMPIHFPQDFNPLVHDMAKYIQSKVLAWKPQVKTTKAHTAYVVDPYVIHRRPIESKGKQRTFVRITFVPIEIYDDACEHNPAYLQRLYNRNANTTRTALKEYHATTNPSSTTI